MFQPFVRYAKLSSFLPNAHFTRAYDARILYIISGEGELILPDNMFALRKHTFVYYPSGTHYYPKSSSERPLEFLSINFDFTREYSHIKNVLPPVKPERFDPQKQHIYNIDSGIFNDVVLIENAKNLEFELLEIAEIFKRQTAYTDELLSAALNVCLYKVLNDPHPENRLVQRIVKYIEENYDGEMDNEKIAREFGYHSYYLNSLFKKEMKVGMHKYIIHFRIQQGAALLQNTDSPVYEIARLCGFKNSDHFSKKFKDVKGVFPTEYRKILV